MADDKNDDFKGQQSTSVCSSSGLDIMNNNSNNNQTMLNNIHQAQTSQDIFKGAEGEFLQERLQVLNRLTKQITLFRQQALDSVNELRNSQKSCMKTEINKSDADRLKSLFDKAVLDCEKEADAVRLSLDLIQEIRNYSRSRQKKMQYAFKNKKSFIRRGQMIKILNDCAHTLPLWIGRSVNEKPPPLCGAIPADLEYIPKIGDLVAALIPTASDIIKPSTSISHLNNPNHTGDWILAEVVHVNGNKFEIDDIDEEQNERHYLTRRSLIPLPLYRANPETNPEALHKRDTRVLALYPQTTCFYRGKVLHAPITANGMYQILFVDHTYQEGFSPPLEVPQRYVVKEPKDAVLETPKKRNRESDHPESLQGLVPKRFQPSMASIHKTLKKE
ncbi:SAGA-associated factor 29 [Dermatophagoides farinae]|uniref:Saga-associated factor 29-like protein n=1 Tax=Dermatophagoides farinae TaxID=6954 RepID=A0A922I7M1_DERFA|nr:SAGA-associated factor 29-like [Dermatophagoides farinae]KAH7639276.1 saga-associated factor 29-like protein [Dermatophagoides farinae]KAH9522165.1 hypothetical protein DERF_005764 [Dermatophagoides farinae]